MLTVVFVKDDFQKSIGLSSMLKNVCSALKTDDKGQQLQKSSTAIHTVAIPSY